MTHADAPIPIAGGRRVERSGLRRAPTPSPTGPPALLAARIRPAAPPLPPAAAFRPSAPPPGAAPFRRRAAAFHPAAPPPPRPRR